MVEEVFDWLDKAGVKEDGATAADKLPFVREEFEELADAIEINGNLEEAKLECVDVMVTALNVLYKLCDGDLEEAKLAVQSVIDSNKSKFHYNPANAKNDAEAYIKGIHPLSKGHPRNAAVRQQGRTHIIYDIDTKKVLKGSFHVPAMDFFKHYKFKSGR